ncbi:hypothetical protein LTR91_018459 [Friedmanniomyces endolithicus]|uniref:Amino acid transporter n=2 Tax=Dothideomycetidae TaxID=451867 RepID=A0AAN6HCH5_9PEZI|nr:hypothetical protein LTR75_010824 [Friedmanniomyces endolithicus]KAK0898087.1 hypothetical protein LTR02_010328 [Friedmanniomyces endolithicus]KAK0954499.1 hypothetical protein LTS01_023880 [Friedmanniomyces endolithicus]KAK0964494.1 hypothetical protein LTR91_018459 [Friedmanniomyces endolithicus]KAK1046077.1 hypothetical protein LTS16_005989 [Friedmanniomyces endolithicus]
MSKIELAEVRTTPVVDDDKAYGRDVPIKYRGTETDRLDMSMLGKTQVLRRQFKFWTMLGFASTVMVAWEFCLLVSPFSLEDGGTPAVFWGLIICPFIMMPMYASLAEVSSMSPTAGGQYHWVSELAPPRFQKVLSYAVGWLIAMGWQTFLCGTSFESASLILGLATLNFPEYQIQSWHQTLLTIAIVASCTFFNIFLAVRLPLVEALILVLHVAGVFAVIIPLWVMAPRGNAYDTILNFTNSGGWWSTGLASTIGAVPTAGLLIGYDCSVHLSEETEDASWTIPQVMLAAVASNAVMLLAVGITYIFCIGDLTSVLSTSTGQPVIQVLFNTTQNNAGTTIITLVIVIILLSACVGQVTTASRQLWSFARDGGAPFSRWLEVVPARWNIPLRAIIVSTMITTLLSMVNLGSNTAFNAFNSLATISILFSYTITIGCLIWRRLFGDPLPPRRWSLGKWGLPLNIISLCCTTPMLFFYVWPLTYPVTPQNMNWSSTMFAAVLFIAAVYYLIKGRHEYDGPVLLVKRNTE